VAELALPPGGTGTRAAQRVPKRAFFGLMDADGWGWAGLRALGWFVLIVLILGYIPDRAYYFTVFPTIDVGANVVSPINLCPADNGTLPCPAPAGAVIPWQGNPAELSLPEGRTEIAAIVTGTDVFVLGGSGGQGASATVYRTTVSSDGNFAPWSEGPALPAPRTNPAVTSFSGTPYVIGGADASGAPTDTVWSGDVQNGALGGWKPVDALKLPKALTGASAVADAAGIWVVGGKLADGSFSASVFRAAVDANGKLGAWQDVTQLPMPAARAYAGAAEIGSYLYVVGGQDQSGAHADVLRLAIDAKGNAAVSADGTRFLGWSVSSGGQSLPRPRTDAATFVSNGALYVVGGRDESNRPTGSLYWAAPNAKGDFAGWQNLTQTNLFADQPRAGAAAVVTSGHVYLIGGQGDGGPSVATFRADLAPRPPFFALGLFGATIPALSIKGEVGQQLGYLMAAGAGTLDFILLILIGLAYSHRAATRRLFSRLTRGRVKPPVENPWFERREA